MTLNDLKNILVSIGPPVFHYSATGQTGNYIVWAEDSEGNSLNADDKKEDFSIQGTIDYFTKTEYDPVVEQIQDKLTEAEISWGLNSVQYEEDTEYIHYEWVWELI